MAHDPISPPATDEKADTKDIKSLTSNDPVDSTVTPVNWLEHWFVHADGAPKRIPFPTGLGPGDGQSQKNHFENLIESYLNCWLDLWNAYQPEGGDPKRVLRGNSLVFIYEPADAEIPRTVRISGRTNPEARPRDVIPGSPARGGGPGGGHLIPPEPPPPPPGSDLG